MLNVRGAIRVVSVERRYQLDSKATPRPMMLFLAWSVAQADGRGHAIEFGVS